MHYDIASAGRTTHLKIVAVALLAATVVVAVGINARVTDPTFKDRFATDMVIKAGKPAAFSSNDGTAVR
jgi:hypothetical protein